MYFLISSEKSRQGLRCKFCRAALKVRFSMAGFKEMLKDDSGVGVVEIILILVVLIALVVIFKEQLTALVQNIFGSITGGVAVITE